MLVNIPVIFLPTSKDRVGRPRDLSLVVRDAEIIEDICRGIPPSVVAAKYGISRSRVSQIVQENTSDTADDVTRDAQRMTLEDLQQELIEIAKGPGRRVMDVKGNLMFDEDDQPMYDAELKIKAALAWASLSERLAKSYALDRPKQKEVDIAADVELAFLSYQKDAEEKRRLEVENEELRRRLGEPTVHEAELVPE